MTSETSGLGIAGGASGSWRDTADAEQPCAGGEQNVAVVR